MRHLVFAAALALAATPALAADPIEGLWLVEAGTAKVKIAPCAANAAQLCGLITWIRDPNGPDGEPAHDANNPDQKLRERPIVGLPMIRDFKRAEPGRWTGGKIYDPNSGKTYDSKLQLNPDGSLKVQGCVLVICRTQTWKRTS